MAHAAQQKRLQQPNEEITDAEFIDGSVDDDFERMQADFEGGDPNEYRVRIYRIMQGKGDLRYLFGALPSDFPILDKIKETYGSGRYEVRLLRQHKIAKRWTQEIEAPPNWKAPVPESEKEDARESTAQIVGAINQAFETFAKVHAPAPVAPAPVIDPMAIQANILASMGQMKALFAPGENAAPPQDTGKLMFQAFSEGMKIMKEVNSDGGESGIWDVLKTMAEPDGLIGKLTDMAQSQNERLTNPPALVDASGRPLPVAGESVQPKPTPEQRHAMFMKMQLATLVQRAKANSDPALYAELILDTVTPEAAAEFVGKPDAIERLIAINPEVANHVEWFRAVGIHINDMLAENEPGNLDGENVTPTTEGDDVATVQDADGTPTRDTERPTGDTSNT